MTKTWFITGASRGIGLLTTEKLLAGGHRVAATLRRPERLQPLKERYGDQLWLGDLDVADSQRIQEVVDAAIAALGRIDVVLSNAGYGLFGAAEELSDAQITDQIATNLLGPIFLTRAILPHLRAQGTGHIIQMSSMGGFVAVPGLSMYHVTKWGAEAFFESVSAEVAAFGIKITLVAPGIVRTGFHDGIVRGQAMDAYVGNPDMNDLTRGEIPHDAMIGDPEKIAHMIINLTEQANPPLRALMGSDAYTWIQKALAGRLEAVEAQRETAALTDFSN